MSMFCTLIGLWCASAPIFVLSPQDCKAHGLKVVKRIDPSAVMVGPTVTSTPTSFYLCGKKR